MSKYRRILLMLARGGHSQEEVAAATGCSKRDVSRCARRLRETGLTAAEIEAMDEAEIVWRKEIQIDTESVKQVLQRRRNVQDAPIW